MNPSTAITLQPLWFPSEGIHPFVDQVAYALNGFDGLDWPENWMEYRHERGNPFGQSQHSSRPPITPTDGSLEDIARVIESTPLHAVDPDFFYSMVEEGWDTLAWYVPLHGNGPAQWGIYFHGPRMRAFGRRMMLDLCETNDHEVLMLATKAILHHEQFHFLVEYFSTQAEQVLERPVYEPYKRKVYDPTCPHKECIEESLANAYALTRRYSTRKLSGTSSSELKHYLRHTCDNAPPAYREYDRYLRPRFGSPRTIQARFRGYCGLLAEIIRDAQLPWEPFGEWMPVTGARFDLGSEVPKALMKTIPTYVVEHR